MHKYLPVFQAKQGKDPRMILMLVITSNRNKYLSIKPNIIIIPVEPKLGLGDLLIPVNQSWKIFIWDPLLLSASQWVGF